MSIEQFDKIDFISTSPTGKVQLTISDHLEWNEEQIHLITLQNKINAYLDFIESGQIIEDYPNVKNKEIEISVVMKYEPTVHSIQTLEKFKVFISEQSFEFSWHVIKDKV